MGPASGMTIWLIPQPFYQSHDVSRDTATPAKHHKIHGLEHLLMGFPSGDIEKRVSANDKKKVLASRLHDMGMKMSQGVNGIRGNRQTGFNGGQPKIRTIGDGQLDHISSMIEISKRLLIFMGRNGSGNKPYLLQMT